MHEMSDRGCAEPIVLYLDRLFSISFVSKPGGKFSEQNTLWYNKKFCKMWFSVWKSGTWEVGDQAGRVGLWLS